MYRCMVSMMSVRGNMDQRMLWRYCTEIFDYLSLSAIIADKIFCVHGRLSPSINKVKFTA